MDDRSIEACLPARLIKQIELSASQFDVFRSLREITDHYNYRYFSVNSLPRDGRLRLSDSVIITSAPSDLVMRHDEYDRVSKNPVLAKAQKSGAPVQWVFGTSAAGEEDPDLAKIREVLGEYDISSWLAIPVFTPGQGAAIISFLGDRGPVGTPKLAELCLLASMVQDRLAQVSAPEKSIASPLTERELECLVWTAAGKTSVEIAKILSLSEHTVNHYLNNATRKSGTVNRTQTVAFALRNGWID
ncbi:helix-turn-helix transcriptional regulator [Pseudohoeflea coraliihabitans]|uniref:LuxR family transcriptional regulator n=1 Tax=Pseudohoeflea coraliihabitans TaxID=2860393 RepID=A0ABS6WMB4_9HYPH|nr:LuxR family transcriptional regulator [Pseudohoeflea sp. DP4N28-3]MBW3097081.1 LuxR family transcriptional regulator [Pseudohoeflea sp. DP4N28-3]